MATKPCNIEYTLFPNIHGFRIIYIRRYMVQKLYIFEYAWPSIAESTCLYSAISPENRHYSKQESSRHIPPKTKLLPTPQSPSSILRPLERRRPLKRRRLLALAGRRRKLLVLAFSLARRRRKLLALAFSLARRKPLAYARRMTTMMTTTTTTTMRRRKRRRRWRMRWEGWPPPDEEGERTKITQQSNRLRGGGG